MDWNAVYIIASAIVNAAVIGFWKPWLSSYGVEKGRILARQEDMDKILDEVHRVAEAQKLVEARLSHDVWERQFQVQQRTTLYSDLLTLLNDLSTAFGGLSNLVNLGNHPALRGSEKALADKIH